MYQLLVVDRDYFERTLVAIYEAKHRREQIAFLKRAGYKLAPAWVAGATAGQVIEAMKEHLHGMSWDAFNLVAQYEALGVLDEAQRGATSGESGASAR